VGWLLSIIGFILVLVAVKYVSDVSQNKSIFNDMLISTVLAIVGVGVGVLVVLSTVLPAIRTLFPGGVPPNPGILPSGNIFSLLGGVLAGLAVIWVFLTISAFFLRRSYGKIAAYLNVGMFNTTALLYLIGAALTIVIVGFIILFVAEILQIIAFFSIPEQPPMPPATVTPTPITTTG